MLHRATVVGDIDNHDIETWGGTEPRKISRD